MAMRASWALELEVYNPDRQECGRAKLVPLGDPKTRDPDPGLEIVN